ncbi:MAG: S24 family peptidase [Acidobacteriota bacterium]
MDDKSVEGEWKQMQTGTVLAARTAELRLLELALPEQDGEVCGVLLFDPSDERLGVRLRRDWETLTDDENDLEVLELLEDDIQRKALEMGGTGFLAYLEETLSNTIRMSEPDQVLMGGFASTLNRLYEKHVPATVQRFKTHLPLWSVRAAAGSYGEQQSAEVEDWIEVPPGTKVREGMFVAHVVGRSMEPEIPSGSMCLFREFGAGSRAGKLVLVEDLSEPEHGERYTIKRYRSTKKASDDGEWTHAEIWMEPLNPEFEPWQLTEDKPARVVGEFLSVLD